MISFTGPINNRLHLNNHSFVRKSFVVNQKDSFPVNNYLDCDQIVVAQPLVVCLIDAFAPWLL